MSEVYEGELVDQESTALATQPGMLQVKSSYSTAVQVQRPREIRDVARRICEEARLMGESAFYGWGAGDSRIEGPSQELALAAARNWGNCAIEVGPVQDTPDSWIITSYFVDLETGFTMARPFKQSKRWTVHGKMDAERKNDVRFQIGATKSARNVILKAIPGWMIEKALDEAKAGVREKIENYIAKKGMAAAQDFAVNALVKLGVKEEAILAKFSVAKRAALDVDALIVMKGDLAAIEKGEIRPHEAYPFAQPETAGKSTTESLKEKLAGEKKSTERESPAPEPEEEKADPRDAVMKQVGILHDTVKEIVGKSKAKLEIAISEATDGKVRGWDVLEDFTPEVIRQIELWIDAHEGSGKGEE